MDFLSYFHPWLLPTVFLLFFSSFIIRKNSSLAASSPNLPPSPPWFPIIGNLHQVIGKSIHQNLWKVSQKYGPIMLLHLGSQPFVIISSSDLAAEALKTHDNILCNRPYSKSLKRLTFNYMDVAFSPYGDHSKKMRKVLVTEFLSAKRSKLFKRVLDTELKNLLDTLSFDSLINLDNMILNLVTDIVCKIAVSKSYREVKFRGTTMKEMLDEMLILFTGSFSEIFPKYGWILEDLSGWSRRLDKHMTNFDGFLEMILDEHIDHTSEDEKDLIDACRSSLTRDEMKSLLSNVFNGAIDTTSFTTVWAMSEIVKNPRVMHRLQEEIRSHSGSKSRLDESDISKMTYLKYVIKETLRIHAPPPMLLTRECVSPIKIGGYDILPGTRVLINSWGIGRDPRVWSENANEFYPERFENQVVEKFEMIPFGGGRRSCPGYNFSTSAIEVLIANLLYNINWKLPTGMTNHDLDMEEKGSLLVAKKTPLCLVPIKNNWQA
ncbi:putative cytochrome P450 [Helianthus anomalus]